jgi:mannitol-specific phosphotransferase system IIBC component
MIAGGATGVWTFMITGAGLVATPSPGSIFAYMAVTPRGGWFGVLLGVIVSAAVTFAVASVLLGFGRGEGKEPVEENTGPQAATVDGPTGADAGAGAHTYRSTPTTY